MTETNLEKYEAVRTRLRIRFELQCLSADARTEGLPRWKILARSPTGLITDLVIYNSVRESAKRVAGKWIRILENGEYER